MDKYLHFTTNLWEDELPSWWASPRNCKRLSLLYMIIKIVKNGEVWYFLMLVTTKDTITALK